MNREQNQLNRRQFVGSLSAATAAVSLATATATSHAEETKAKGKVPSRQEGHEQLPLIAGEKFEELEFAAFTGLMSWVRAAGKGKLPPVDVVVAGFDHEITGFGSMHIRPEMLAQDLGDEDLDEFDAVGIPAALSREGVDQLRSQRTHDIVRKIHANGGVIATMCDGIAAVPKDIRGKTCQYWARGKAGRPNGEQHAPIVVDNRIMTTAGQAVAVPAVVVLLELLFGEEQTKEFTSGCACMFGFHQEFVQRVSVFRTGA